MSSLVNVPWSSFFQTIGFPYLNVLQVNFISKSIGL